MFKTFRKYFFFIFAYIILRQASKTFNFDFSEIDMDNSKDRELMHFLIQETVLNNPKYGQNIAEIAYYGKPLLLFNNTWSIIYSLDFYNYLYLTIIWLPLFFSLYIFFLYLYYYSNVLSFGTIFGIEDKSINFQKRFKKNIFMTLRTMLSYFPTFNASRLFLFPSILNLFYIQKTHFLWKPRIKTLPFYFIFFLIILFFFGIDATNFYENYFFLIIATFVSFSIALKFHYMKNQLGLKLKHLLIKNKKFSQELISNFYKKMFFRKNILIIPIVMAFLIFLFSNYLLIFMYKDFFFKPVLTWNGYFSNTIISLFLQGDYPFIKSRTKVPLDYFVALDGLNIWLIWLTSLLVFLCSLFCFDKSKTDDFILQMGWIFFLQFASFQFFCVCNYLWMYIFFELSLLPIYILIIFWGSNWRKVHAAYQMVLFTFIGSLFLLIGIFMLFNKFYTFNTFDIFFSLKENYQTPLFSLHEKKIIWIFLFLGFAVKTPLYPFHIWLPEAHSEAPTVGSVLLAGVLLKMGTYGFMRYVIPLFPEILEYYKTLIYFMCLSGILFSSMSALAQIDIKKIIAYSSIGHMGLVILGITTQNSYGLLGSSFMMISHGLISGALFFSIGLLYKIYGTRSILHYTGIAHFMPRFSLCFFIFNLSNMGFPGTAGFPAEILIFSALVEDNFFLTIFSSLGSILGGCYSIWLLTRVIYGQISPKISVYWDLKPIEWKILIVLVFFIFLFGIFPFIMIDFFKPFCSFFTAILY